MKGLRLVLVPVAMHFSLVAAVADHYFCGGTNSAWNEGSNWKSASNCSGADAGVPTAADSVIILSGKTCNIGANAQADHITVSSTATLNIQAGYKLEMDGDGLDVSTIDGTVNLEGSGSELEFRTSDHTLEGGGKIVGQNDAAIIDINGEGRDLYSEITIEGNLKIIGPNFHNEGVVKANRSGMLWVNCNNIVDISTAVWRTDPNVVPGAAPDAPVLRMDDTDGNTLESLLGVFILYDGTLNVDAGFCCTGGLTVARGKVVGDSNGNFKSTCP